jgi:hypothetical protein
VILYANGDSHTHGIGVTTEENFASLVADRINYDCVNHAKIGASNAGILRTTRDFLKDNTPDLIMIGWSSWEREEWKHNGHYYNVNSSGHDVMPDQLQIRYKQWVTDQSQDLLTEKSKYWNSEIYQFHLELKQQRIKHLFFNTLYNFFGVDECHDWGHAFLGPYNNELSYYWYLKNQNFKPDEWYHFKSDAHSVWADRLIQELI